MANGGEGVWVEMVCPRLDSARAQELGERLYGLQGGSAQQLDGYDDQNFWLRPTAVACNPHLPTPCPSGYTLKIMNSRDSLNLQFIEEQTYVLTYLGDRGIRCPKPVKNKTGETYSIERFEIGGPAHAIRLMEFIPGHILGKVPWHPDLAVQAGRELANIDSILEVLKLPFLDTRNIEWSLWSAPNVLTFLDDVLHDESRIRIVREVFSAFSREVKPECRDLQSDSALIHGDYNQFNIIVEHSVNSLDRCPYSISGVLDFGDCHRAPRLFEVAIAAAYMALQSGDVNAIAGVLKGYSEGKIFHGVGKLKVCIEARLCQSLIMGLKAHQQDPGNLYVLDSQVKGWQILQELHSAPLGAFEEQWKDITMHTQAHENNIKF